MARGQQHALRAQLKVFACTSDFANKLADGDARFVDEVVDVVIKPTRPSGKNSAISIVPGEPNQQSAVCPTLLQWLYSATREGEWECADAEQCQGHHDCKAGIECDVVRRGDLLPSTPDG